MKSRSFGVAPLGLLRALLFCVIAAEQAQGLQESRETHSRERRHVHLWIAPVVQPPLETQMPSNRHCFRFREGSEEGVCRWESIHVDLFCVWSAQFLLAQRRHSPTAALQYQRGADR